MFSRLSKSSRVKRVLLVSLSNIGDVILTFPVFDVLRERFPDADISVVVGPKAHGLLQNNPHIYRLFIYNKRALWAEKWHWLQDLRAQEFDLVVDLRNSFLPFLVKGSVTTWPVWGKRFSGHMKDKHLSRLKSVLENVEPPQNKCAFYISSADEKHARESLQIDGDYVVVAPGAADHRKCWPEDRFARVISYLKECHKTRVVIVGDKKDAEIAQRALSGLGSGVVNVAGGTTLPQLGAILKGARLAVTNDSGIMHMASYLHVPVIALFGPTDPDLYGPWSGNQYVLRQGESMEGIQVEDVCSAIDDWFHGHARF